MNLTKVAHLNKWGSSMSDNNYFSLKDMYINLQEEAEGLELKIKKNLLRISEIDEYLDSLYNKEDEDYKVFSPWNVEHIYKENINNNKTEKYQLENDNKELYSRLNRVRSYMYALESDTSIAKQEDNKSLNDSNVSPVTESLQKVSNLTVLDIQESERQRIARDLHDTSLQNLAHLVHKIELASMYIDKDPLQAKLELAAVNKNMKTVIEEIRNTIFDLRPMSFDDLGLKESFERLFYKFKELNTSFEFDIQIDEIKSDNDIILLNIFRVVQEAGLNAIKHSGGSKISVVIKQVGNICEISVKDNGTGFTEELIDGKHFGISIMKERVRLLGGNLIFDSMEDEGTEVKIHIPL